MQFTDVAIIAGILLLLSVGIILILVHYVRIRPSVRRERHESIERRTVRPQNRARPYFLISEERLTELYRESLSEQPAEKREIQYSRTIKGDGSVELGVGSLSGGGESQSSNTSQFHGEETSPARRASAFERQLEENGEIRRIDFSTDKPFDSLVKAVERQLAVAGIKLTPAILGDMRSQWAAQRGAMGAPGLGRSGDNPLRGFVSVRAKFRIESAPSAAHPDAAVKMRVSNLPAMGTGGTGGTFLVEADGHEILPNARSEILLGQTRDATAVGFVISSRDDADIVVRAVYCYWDVD